MKQQQTFISLCTGIGGFELAAKLANQLQTDIQFEPIAFVEKDPHCQKLLARRFKNVPIFSDLTKLTADELLKEGIIPDGICGGLPCQPFSIASKNSQGNRDSRNLFPHFLRILGDLQPRWAILENVPTFATIDSGRDFRDFLWQVAQSGYDAEWDIISCSAIGGPNFVERMMGYSEKWSNFKIDNSNLPQAELLTPLTLPRHIDKGYK